MFRWFDLQLFNVLLQLRYSFLCGALIFQKLLLNISFILFLQSENMLQIASEIHLFFCYKLHIGFFMFL